MDIFIIVKTDLYNSKKQTFIIVNKHTFMKKYIPVLMVCCLAMTVFVSCSTKMTSKPGSSGKTLELIIIADNNVYSGTTKQTLQNIFEAPQDGLNQPQPRFDVVRMLPADFNGNTMFQAHRNLLVLEVDPQGANKVLLNYDQWATPQVLIRDGVLEEDVMRRTNYTVRDLMDSLRSKDVFGGGEVA